MSTPLDSPGRVEQSGVARPADAGVGRLNQAGTLRGERVTRPENPAAKLADAAEELGFAESERMESRLAKRRITSGEKAKSFAKELAEKYLKQIPDLDKDKLAEFGKKVFDGSQPDMRQLRELARQFSNDPSHQFAAMSWALEDAEAKGDAELAAALRSARDDLMADEGPAVDAGLNVSATAEAFAANGLGETGQLRDMYRRVVLDYGTVTQAWDKIAEQYPDRNFPDAVSFLRRGLAAELSAERQSLAPEHLKRILDDLGNLKALLSIYDRCGDLLQRVSDHYGAPSRQFSTSDMVKEVLVAKESGWQTVDNFTNMPSRLGIAPNEPSIYFLRGFREVVRLAPLKMFDEDMVKRERLLQSLQIAMDTLIENEEFDD